MTGASPVDPADPADAAFAAFVAAPAGPAREDARRRAIEAHLPLVRYLAARFAHRGEPFDDLVQVGTVGLILAVDRYDATRGTDFVAYATPTVVGEIRRHFRDRTATVRLPRRVHEVRAELAVAVPGLTQRLARTPTVAELADHLGIGEGDVLEAIESASAPVPLDTSTGDSGAAARVPPVADRRLAAVEDRMLLEPLLARLTGHARDAVILRYVHNLTQAEIAVRLGVSPMSVSRLLGRAMTTLRATLPGGNGPEGGPGTAAAVSPADAGRAPDARR